MGGDSSVLRPDHPLARSLAALVDEFELDVVGDVDDVEVSGLTISSAGVHPGDLFVGMPGARVHGAGFAVAAKDRGAVAVLTDREGAALAAPAGLPVVVVESPGDALGAVAAWVYRTAEDPPLLFGVTGTNGKTERLLPALRHPRPARTRVGPELDRGAPYRGCAPSPVRSTTPEASELHGAAGPDARVRGARRRDRGQRSGAHPAADRWTRVRCGVVPQSRARPPRRLRRHGHLLRGQSCRSSIPTGARKGVVSLDSGWGARVVADPASRW